MIAVAFPKRLLVDTDVWNRVGHLTSLTAHHRARHHAPGFIPRDAGNATGPGHCAALLNQIDDEPFHQQREATARFRPGDARLFDAMRRALHQRNLGVHVRLKLAGVQMPPDPLLRMVEPGQQLAAFRTRPPRRDRA